MTDREIHDHANTLIGNILALIQSAHYANNKVDRLNTRPDREYERDAERLKRSIVDLLVDLDKEEL